MLLDRLMLISTRRKIAPRRFVVAHSTLLLFAMLLAAGLSGSSTSVHAQGNKVAGSEEMRREFKSPAKRYRPMIRWWWPGGDVKDAELIREVGLMDEAGFGGAELQPFRFGLNHKLSPEAENRVNDYLTPSFYEHVSATAEELRRRGMWLDLTFGSGWPFGGGLNMTPELASMELRYTHEKVHGPATFHRKISMPPVTMETGEFVRRVIGGSQPLPAGWEQRLRNRSKLVAVVAVRGSEPETAAGPQTLIASAGETMITKSGVLDPTLTTVLTGKVSEDGTLDWQVPDGDWELLTFAEAPTDLWILGGVGAYPQLVLDHMKLAAMESHIERVGESAKKYAGSYFGNGIRAIFCDSLEVRAFIFWTSGFLEDFKRLRGYDLTPYLPYIRQPGFNDPYAAGVGLPVYDASDVGERVRRDYWQTVSDLMDERFYTPLDDWAHRNHLLARVQAHGAPADLLKVYGQADIPETEHLFAGGHPDFLRMAASAAHVYGHPIASSESFAIAGNPYLTTPERIKIWSDELLTSGINEIVFHGFPYEYLNPPQPGWYPFTSPLAFSTHLNQHSTFWEYLPPLNEYLTRLQYLAQAGHNVAQVAVYRSALSYQAKPVPDPEIDARLVAAGYNFDQFNNEALLASRVAEGKLVAPSAAAYSVLVFDNERQVPLALAEKLADFRRQGLPIIFVGSVPNEEAGFKDWQANSRKIQALLQGISATTNLDDAISAMQDDIKPDITFDAGSESVPFFHRKVNGSDVFFLRNPDPESRTLNLVFPVQSSPETWNPWSGAISEDYSFKRTANGIAMKIVLPPFGSRLLVFDPAQKHEPHLPASQVPPALGVDSISIGQSGQKWTLMAGSQQLEISELADWLAIEQLKAFSGTAEYETRFSIDDEWLKDSGRVVLDLGEVHDVARITLNDKAGPILLLRPYVADVTSLIRPGENILKVAVTNSWTNHLLSEGVNLTNPSAPKPVPERSGLIGPVKLTATH